ncbi:MAG: Uma2 family endonuclease [Deltaproteobacteria bacterium]|nr:Uma2 family endonuclease [Deltaproteobacteria bacterium]
MANGAAGELVDAGNGSRMKGRMGKKPARKPRPRKVTSKEILAEPEERRLEVIAGVVEEKAAPSFDHSVVQNQLGGLIGQHFGSQRRGGPGGWWIGTEADIELGPHDLVRPDVAGWRRDRHAVRPRGRPVRQVPDWVCELVSASNRKRDTVEKVRLYHPRELFDAPTTPPPPRGRPPGRPARRSRR